AGGARRQAGAASRRQRRALCQRWRQHPVRLPRLCADYRRGRPRRRAGRDGRRHRARSVRRHGERGLYRRRRRFGAHPAPGWLSAMPLDLVPSVCPHDCPSTCALEVERIDARTIGRIHGARDNSYTAGVICAKVARYAERQHHPDRLARPMRRVGDKGVGRDAFAPIAWDDALDMIADAFARAAQRYGSETVWPYYYAGTMGHVQRDGIHRLRHAMRYSGQDPTICVRLADTGWAAGTGAKRGVDAREMPESDLVVVWGGNPVNTQVNVMHYIARARHERGAKLVVVDTYRTGTAEQADLFLPVRPGTDGALACAVMHVLFRDGYADRAYLAKHTDATDALEA